MRGREAIAAALLAALSSIPGIKKASRHVQTFDDTPAVDQPALFVEQGGQSADRGRGRPTKWTLHFRLALYVHGSKDAPDPVRVINDLLDAIDAICGLQPSGLEQTLGIDGVQSCSIAGDVEVFEGRLGDQSAAIIPIEVIAL